MDVNPSLFLAREVQPPLIDLRGRALKGRNLLLTHEHVMCTLDAGADAAQLTSKETRPTARYARQSAGAFADPKPHTPGRDPVRVCGGYGLP